MQRARDVWGNADVIDGNCDHVHQGNNRPPEGGPVHKYLIEKREAKLRRRAQRYAKQFVSK